MGLEFPFRTLYMAANIRLIIFLHLMINAELVIQTADISSYNLFPSRLQNKNYWGSTIIQFEVK